MRCLVSANGELIALAYDAARTVRWRHDPDVTLSDVQSAWGGLVSKLLRGWKRPDLEN